MSGECEAAETPACRDRAAVTAGAAAAAEVLEESHRGAPATQRRTCAIAASMPPYKSPDITPCARDSQQAGAARSRMELSPRSGRSFEGRAVMYSAASRPPLAELTSQICTGGMASLIRSMYR